MSLKLRVMAVESWVKSGLNRFCVNNRVYFAVFSSALDTDG